MIYLLPAQYAKFITSLVGMLVVYLQMYGATWHLVPAVLGIAASLGVMGVPNSKPAAVPPPPAPQSQATNQPPLFPPSALPGRNTAA